MLKIFEDNEYIKEKERNAVFIGFSDEEKIKNTFISGREYIDNERAAIFPKIYYYNSVDDAKRLHGFCVYIKVDFDYQYIKNNYIELDKLYRRKFRNFRIVVLYSDKFKENIYFDFGKFSSLRIVDKYVFFDYNYNYFDNIYEEYRDYCINYKKKRISNQKKKKLNILREILSKENELSTYELNEMTGISIRNIQRYMHDINDIYNDVGYDEVRNIWYIV